MTDSIRRRKRKRINSEEETKPILQEEEWSEEKMSEVTVGGEKKSHRIIIGEIDQIRSELMEERNSSLIESDYWDETHSWGSDDDEASDEYWHFLGRYE